MSPRHRRVRPRHIPRAVHAATLLALLAVAALAISMTALPGATNMADAHSSSAARTHQQQQQQPRHTDDDREKHHHDPRVPATPQTATCLLNVPAAPTAAGLSVPWELRDGTAACSQADDDTSAFVEATSIDPATGNLFVYRPLVVTHGTQPAAVPTAPSLPAGAVTGVFVGFNGDTLHLVGPGATSCVNGLPNSDFGQVSFCGTTRFFQAAKQAIRAGLLNLPAVVTSPVDGMPCPTVRDFSVVDQDQSDNVSTSYLLLADGRTAQDTPANRTAFPTASVLVNGSDNGLLNRKIHPALQCPNLTAPDLTTVQPGAPVAATTPRVASQALNEIQAFQQGSPVARVPMNDPMTQVNDRPNFIKTAVMRTQLGQPLTGILQTPGPNGSYCTSLKKVQPSRLEADRAAFTASTSPTPGVNLYDFMQARLAASLETLGC